MRSHQYPQVPLSPLAFSGDSYPRISSRSIGPSIHRGTREASICATTSVGKITAPLSLPVPQARANSSSRPGITPAMCPKIRNSISCPISPMCGENTFSQRSFLGVK
ncbi:hypothetical protein HOY80DRAFT_1011096 [Tuber brumale]|nr:hypothetical protein HOY80DRAFT_1011096 [Tuber brumale]